jgi:hypothetical protein
MLVSAAMAERPSATAPGRSRPAPAAQAPAARHSTARVATTQGARRSELPGWFWGALGCLTVLVVGLTVVFVMGQQGVASAPTVDAVPAVISTPPAQAAAAPGAAPRGPEAQLARGAGIRVEPMAAPPGAIEQVVPAPVVAKPKAPVRPLKVARSPAAAKTKPAGASKPAAEDEEGEDEPKAKPRAAAPAADDESDER